MHPDVMKFDGRKSEPPYPTDSCDECGTQLINDCLVCGAPVCCPKCCAEATEQAADIEKEEPALGPLEEECLRRAEQENGPRDQWREKVHSELMRDKPTHEYRDLLI